MKRAAKSSAPSPALSPAEYAAQVMDLLIPRFADLATDPAGKVVREAIVRQVAEPVSHFEVILDSPLAANWRLKDAIDGSGKFRVADCRLFGTRPDVRVDEINAALAAL